MKIGLNIAGNDMQTSKVAENKAFENVILSAQKGDWKAKDELVQRLRPLVLSLAEKRSTDGHMVSKYVEAAKNGILTAADRYKPAIGPDKFRIFALDFIEDHMDRVGKGRSFLSRLFGKR